jgi:hypothetical protein
VAKIRLAKSLKLGFSVSIVYLVLLSMGFAQEPKGIPPYYPTPYAGGANSKNRPIMGGDPIGYWKKGYGTIGMPIIDYNGRFVFFITNNHVISYPDTYNSIKIFQPAVRNPWNSKDPEDVMFWAYDYIQVENGLEANNTIDAARVFVDIYNHDLVDFLPEVRDIGKPSIELGECKPFQSVYKRGAKTGLQKSYIVGCSSSVIVQGWDGTEARFIDQILVSSVNPDFIKCGDSGSILFTEDNKPLGIATAVDNCEGGKSWWGKLQYIADWLQ